MNPPTKLRVLVVDDSPEDAMISLSELRRAGFEVVSERVDNDTALRRSLTAAEWDIAICDWSMPGFGGDIALRTRNELRPDLPWLIVSGTVSEENAVKAMQSGAQDYFNKAHLARLAPAIRRELTEAADRRARRRAEEQFLQAQKMEAVGRLAGGVAHDFNNLLTVIGGYSDLLLMRTPEGAAGHRELGEIRRAAERAAGLTRQLLAFSRRQAILPTVFDLNVATAGMSAMLQRLLGADVELSVVPATTPAWIRADLGQVEQVLMNLAVNARDAMPQGGRVVLRIAPVTLREGEVAGVAAGAAIRLDVSDTGVGMSPETLQRLFEPFFTTKEVGKGTGLGLATVHGIVSQAGGGITVASVLGKGSTFSVHFPQAAVPAPAACTDPTSSAARPGGNETILVVDDSGAVLRLAAEVLRAAGYRVLEAPGGAEGLRYLEPGGEAVHLVLVDIVMPLLSGPEFARTAQTLRPGIKVLFMSGYADRPEILEQEGRFVQKPFTPAGLAAKVREALDRR